ncbi:hypothetical protein QEW_4477 [Clostridioides difficile CD160]|nr:hypothetical protein QEW_4477 [Clostridioides difficile CD160]
MYKNECFKEDLAELASYQPFARHNLGMGTNPLAINYENIRDIVLAVYDYLPEIKTMAIFRSLVTSSFRNKWSYNRN